MISTETRIKYRKNHHVSRLIVCATAKYFYFESERAKRRCKKRHKIDAKYPTDGIPQTT